MTAREIVERVGLDAGDLVGRSISAASGEFSAIHHNTGVTDNGAPGYGKRRHPRLCRICPLAEGKSS